MIIKIPTHVSKKVYIQLYDIESEIIFTDEIKENKPKFDCNEELFINETKEEDWVYYNLSNGIPYLPSVCKKMVSVKISIPKNYYEKIWIDSNKEINISDTCCDDEVLIKTGCIRLHNATLPNAQINYNRDNVNKQFLDIKNSSIKNVNIRLQNGGILTIDKSSIDKVQCLNDFDLKKELTISKCKINHAEIQGYHLNVEDCNFKQIRCEDSDQILLANSQIETYFYFINSNVVLNHCKISSNGCNDGGLLKFENYRDLYSIEDDMGISYLYGNNDVKTILKENDGKIL